MVNEIPRSTLLAVKNIISKIYFPIVVKSSGER
ncbi:hypothetical protein BH23BAC3_BH23BAC3_35190 [soil metagenome]